MRVIKLLFILLQFATIFSVSAQELLIKDSKSKKVRVFREGNSFLFMTRSNEEYTKGKIQEVKDSSVVMFLPDEEVPEVMEIGLSEFTVIRKPSKLHYFAYALGSIFMINGALFLLEGPNVTDTEVVNRGIGAVSFAIGLIPFLTNVRTYELDHRYFLQVRLQETKDEPESEEIQPVPEGN